MKRLLAIVVLLAPLAGCEGLLNAPNPRTVVEVDPAARKVYLYNNKDVDVEIVDLSFNLTEKSAKLGKLTLKDKASSVREASVQQMLAIAQQQAEVTRQIQSLGNIVASIIPFLGKQQVTEGNTLQTAWGTFGTTKTSTPVVPPAATQPGGG